MKKSIIPICLAVFVLFLTSCYKPPKQVVSNKPGSKVNSEQIEKKEIESLLKELKQRNPFRADQLKSASSRVIQGTQLEGIIWDDFRPLALIGSSVVGVGEFVGAKRVVKINKDSVTLDNQGKEEVLRLPLTSQ